MFENKVLRRIFGPKSDEVTGEWRKLHNEDSIIITKPTNALIVCNLFLNHFFKTLQDARCNNKDT